MLKCGRSILLHDMLLKTAHAIKQIHKLMIIGIQKSYISASICSPNLLSIPLLPETSLPFVNLQALPQPFQTNNIR